MASCHGKVPLALLVEQQTDGVLVFVMLIVVPAS